MKRLALAIGCFAVLSAPAVVRAQLAGQGIASLYGGPVHSEGPGIKISDSLVLHPGIQIGAGFDSNLFAAASGAIGAAYFMARPHLALSTLPPQRLGDSPRTLEFRLHLAAGLRLPFALGGANQSEILKNNYSVDVDGGIALSFFPRGAYAFDILANYARTSQLPWAISSNRSNINRDNARLALGLKLRPGGRRFEILIQYVPGLSMFESPTISGERGYTEKNLVTNDIQLRLAWKFFPKTALYLNAHESIQTYVSPGCSTPPNSYPVRAVLGMIGLITTKLSVDVNVGYGNTLIPSGNAAGNCGYDAATDHKVVASLVVNWRPTLLTNLQLGFRQDFGPALVGRYYDFSSPYLFAVQQIWRLQLGARLSYEYRKYSGRLAPDGLSSGANGIGERADHILALHTQLDLPIKDYLFVGVGYDLTFNKADNCGIRGGGGGAEPCNYLRNDVWLRLGVAY